MDCLSRVDAGEWDALTQGREPFLRHVFLDGLERFDCLGKQYGWFPQHVLLRNDEGQLLAAAPCYVKTNNYGEFVFDWAWQSAWERSGQRYYPKLVVSIPYNPAGGPRLLVHPKAPDPHRLRQMLLQVLIQLGEKLGASGVHILFPVDHEANAAASKGLILRTGCQYHWENQNYRDFEDFLAAMTSKRRKSIKRERRRVHEAGIQFRVLDGHTAGPEDWQRFHRFYVDTFEKHMGIPTLSQDFFQETAQGLGQQVVLFEARRNEDTIAAALCYRSEDTLYGRFWGCREELPDLHFETCYYQGIDFCIRERLRRFEPGAQGEHKIPRGFLPRPTYSQHYILTPGFADAVNEFCHRESQWMQEQCATLQQRSPFRQTDE